jgi:hypothetical protein
MTNRPPQDAPQNPPGAKPDAERSWVAPVLVEYGHLAKLTRGASGTVTEPSNRMMCL